MVIGVMQPTSIFSNINNNRTQQELLALANEMAQTIAYDNRDWNTLVDAATFAGNGSLTAFPLPTNYQRMLLTANVYRSTMPQVPMLMVTTQDEWTRRKMQNYWMAQGQWILRNGNIEIQPTLISGETATFTYLDNRCIKSAGGTRQTSFLTDTDLFVLPERLLKLGMIWRWKSNKGSPYAEDMGTYSDALANISGHDQPAPIYVDTAPLSSQVAANVAYPWQVPTP